MGEGGGGGGGKRARGGVDHGLLVDPQIEEVAELLEVHDADRYRIGTAE